jgi:hypothetical protein
MRSPLLLLGLYCLLILLGSLAGGWIPLWVRLTHTRLQLAMSGRGDAGRGPAQAVNGAETANRPATRRPFPVQRLVRLGVPP